MSDSSLNYDGVTFTLSDDYMSGMSGPSADSYTMSWNNSDTITLGATGANVYPWSSDPTMSWDTKIKLKGDGADIEVNGESLMSMIKTIEQRLNILKPNEALESEWAELQALGDQYRALEQHILDKQATWDKLKAMPPPEID
jgi:hypothetical protein